MSSASPRILFAGGGTGGHLYPALALADAFQRMEPRTEVFFVGARRGVEARVLPERAVPHVLLPFEPIRRDRPWQNWRLVPAMFGSLAGLARAFRSFQPDLVVGTGGYASGPAVGWGILTGLPTAVQEQNSFPGLTTRWVAPRTRQIHLAFPEARGYLKPGPRTEVFELGNPIQPPDPSISREQAREHFGLGSGVVALIVGGSQGARPINDALLADLAAVADGTLPPHSEGFELLWATGPSNYDGVAAQIATMDVSTWVHVVPYIERMPYALAAADLAVSRAGAMALAELCAWGIPSILVPFPHAAANHQHHNAVALDQAGAAIVVPESELAGGRLWTELTGLAASPQRRSTVAERARGRGRPDAADRIVEALAKLLGR
jgi:UDP-N-acetylglucosamine--N-acetylmuramyl-(pentapeptide) pyrophosphoryl-undecaprenol N-acetylglucosamine transferase